MSAFNDFLSRSSLNNFQKFRESLISNRGNLSNGKFPKCMDIMLAKDKNSVDKIFVKKQDSYSKDGGFVFDTTGTEKALEHISQNSPLLIYDNFSNHFCFASEEKKELWEKTSEANKKKIIALNIDWMIKKTDINYRTLGDRSHYFTVGKIKRIEKGLIKHYPLFLFACSNVDEKKQRIEIEAKGFLNFWLDKNILDNEISKMIKGICISINEDFNMLLVNIQHTLDNINIAGSSDNIEFDHTYSAIGIVTGFESEYLDPVWDKILNSR
jgi:hypothetical protein